MLSEFRDFINRGNVIDLAVAVIIGATFSAIVTSLVNDIIMPVIGIITGGVNFSGLVIKVGDAVISYGNFVQAVINFLLITLVVFTLVRAVNKLRRKQATTPAQPPAPTTEEKLLTEIRDLLQMQVRQ